MDAKEEREHTAGKNRTTVERKSEREAVVTRTVNGPARIVFQAWTQPDLLRRWWVPKGSGMSLLSCDMDVRVGGKYRLVFSHGGATVQLLQWVIRGVQQLRGGCPTMQVDDAEVALCSGGGAGALFTDVLLLGREQP